MPNHMLSLLLSAPARKLIIPHVSPCMDSVTRRIKQLYMYIEKFSCAAVFRMPVCVAHWAWCMSCQGFAVVFGIPTQDCFDWHKVHEVQCNEAAVRLEPISRWIIRIRANKINICCREQQTSKYIGCCNCHLWAPKNQTVKKSIWVYSQKHLKFKFSVSKQTPLTTILECALVEQCPCTGSTISAAR